MLDFQVLESVPGPDADGFVAPAPPPVDSPFADPAPAAGDPGAGGAEGGIPGLDPLPPADEPTEAIPGATGTNRVLVAAAHQETVARMIGAVRAAGLKVAAVDLVPLALVRALGRRVAPDGPGAEGIVSIGGGVTVIVVHEGGLPRFVRMLGTGGRSLTEAIARDLDLTLETAEALKRQGENSPPELAPRVTAALERPLSDLLEEVRGSLDYWRTQPGSARLLRVTVTGGVSLQPGVVDGLSRVLGVPVEQAQPREGVEVGDIGFPPDEVAALDPYLPVPIGLALGGSPGGKRINLSGSDRGSNPTDTRKLALVLGAVGLGLLLLLGLLSFQKQSQTLEREGRPLEPTGHEREVAVADRRARRGPAGPGQDRGDPGSGDHDPADRRVVGRDAPGDRAHHSRRHLAHGLPGRGHDRSRSRFGRRQHRGGDLRFDRHTRQRPPRPLPERSRARCRSPPPVSTSRRSRVGSRG